MRSGGFHHEALLYGTRDEFLRGTTTFVRDGLAAGAPVLAVVEEPKIALLRDALGADAERVSFADMAEVGANPARIIPAWQEFLDRHASAGGIWGIGEPVSTRRSPEELVECHRHEALLNLAFADAPGFELLCPYDTTALSADVIAHVQETHPVLAEGEVRCDSHAYRGDTIAGAFCDPLPDPPATADRFTFDIDSLRAIRRLVFTRARDEFATLRSAEDYVTAVNEIATNSIRHAGGTGALRLWSADHTLVCEITDAGTIQDPLVGRRAPDPHAHGGFGHWIANQACDLVQVRSTAAGTAVRMHLQCS